MTGQPYRGRDGSFEPAAMGPLDLADDAQLFGLLVRHPDWLGEDVVFFADGRVIEASDPGQRTIVGWRREGGAVLLVVTTAAATAEALVEVAQLAEANADWDVEDWDAALARFWKASGPSLRAGVAERWDLPAGRDWGLETWTKTAWEEPPAEGRAAIGIVAGEVPARIARAIDWLAASGRDVAAFRVQRLDAGGEPTYWTTPAAGGWGRRAAAVPETVEAGLRRATYVRHTGGVTAGLLAAIESACAARASRVAWSGEDWVRFDGPDHSLRVFPGAAWVDLQLVGADEGTLKGLLYRYGLGASLAPPADAPPGVHLRLANPGDYTSGVELLLGFWLGGPHPPGGPGGAGGDGAPDEEPLPALLRAALERDPGPTAR